MMDRPFVNTPTAVRLREMHNRGMTWREIGAVLGYHYTTAYHCAVGRDKAGPALVRDVAQMHQSMEAV
jgi:hypothetical protein